MDPPDSRVGAPNSFFFYLRQAARPTQPPEGLSGLPGRSFTRTGVSNRTAFLDTHVLSFSISLPRKVILGPKEHTVGAHAKLTFTSCLALFFGLINEFGPPPCTLIFILF